MTSRVELPAALADRIRAEARTVSPRECCGLLEGMREVGGFRVLALHPMHNLSPDADHFEMDPQGQFAAQRTARGNGAAIIGCYHSHPRGAAQPSAADLAGAGEEEFLWLIAGEAALRAFVYLRGEFVGADCVTSSE